MTSDFYGFRPALTLIARDALKLGGRTPRPVFLRGLTVYAVVYAACLATQSASTPGSGFHPAHEVAVLLIALAAVPLTTLTVRRLRDAGHSPAWVWICWVAALVAAWAMYHAVIATARGATDAALWQGRMLASVITWIAMAILTLVLAMRRSSAQESAA
ncbi:DUF805 domain-containing protein (plasmid) [Acidiphilium multivorum]|uniref:DUF805 domain-containing protein n=1 Tax=Acidiphilium multivorum TaxID=62140 RepID=UPI001F4C2040|nr:hypothetical protein [Acidiphilium multivorum]UNC16174.1 DUF805 domain-containing protein [Acidiphilium multivorum]